MITKTTLALLAYLCVAGFVADAQYCNSTSCPGNKVCFGINLPVCSIGVVCSCSTPEMKLNGSMCVTPTVSLNGSCVSDFECKGFLTYCSSGKCACYPTYTAKSDGSDCMAPTPAPVVPLNNNCTAPGSSCGIAATCTSGFCKCTAGYTPIGGSNNADCRLIKLNDPCNNTFDCPSTSTSRQCANANCNSGNLQCNSGYHWVTSETLSFESDSYTGGCVPNNVTANVVAGQPCSDSQTGGNTYLLCANGLTCTDCGGSYTCQGTSSPTTTPKNGAANVRLDMMALVSILALAVLHFAA